MERNNLTKITFGVLKLRLEHSYQTAPMNEVSKKLCENNGGKFIARVVVTNGGYSDICLLPGGRYCEELGFNKCVESKGTWQPDYE